MLTLLGVICFVIAAALGCTTRYARWAVPLIALGLALVFLPATHLP